MKKERRTKRRKMLHKRFEKVIKRKRTCEPLERKNINPRFVSNEERSNLTITEINYVNFFSFQYGNFNSVVLISDSRG